MSMWSMFGALLHCFGVDDLRWVEAHERLLFLTLV